VERFHPTTAPEEARHLTAMCLEAIAAGWPSLYFRQPALAGAQATLDTTAMIQDAADMAATLTQAVDFRMASDYQVPFPERGN
jgi:hypothetical protein